jgi:hypothetical protein|tara:strand:- start:293 stop:475 length:183 start_codon:yes stop_codon:yes gene_type:complete
MGLMTTAVMSTIFSPLSGLWSSLDRTIQVVGYSKAAAELARLGYHEESKACMMEIAKLRN